MKPRNYRYRVTQPKVGASHQAQYPVLTTRIESNTKYIIAANHPGWYNTASRHEDRLLASMTKASLQTLFKDFQSLREATTPLHAYGFAMMHQLNQYVRENLKGDPMITSVFNNAAATVITNLANNIFAGSSSLTGEHYSWSDRRQWLHNLKQFREADSFTFRPPECGRDVDGQMKPIIEICPTPRLGRHLVVAGSEILMSDVESHLFTEKGRPTL